MSLLLRIEVKQKKIPPMKTAQNYFPSIPVPFISFITFIPMLLNAVKVLNNSYDFTIRLLAALVVMAMFPALTMILDIGLQTKKLATLYQTFQAIVDSEGMPYLLDSDSHFCM